MAFLTQLGQARMIGISEEYPSSIHSSNTRAIHNTQRVSPNSSPFEPPPVFQPALDTDAMLMDALQSYHRKDFNTTITICQAILSSSTRKSDILVLQGAAYYQLGDFQTAMSINDSAVLHDPGCPEAHANLANCLQQMGSYDLAIVYYQAALQLKPDFVDALLNMGATLLKKGQLAEAAKAYQAAVSYKDDLKEAWSVLGDVWKMSKAYDEANKCYSKALALDKNFAPPLRGLGDIRREMGHLEQALEVYKVAEQLDPNSAETLSGIGLVMKQLGNNSVAEHFLSKAVNIRPSDPLSMASLAEVLCERGNYQTALEAYKRALQCQQSYTEQSPIYNNMGNCFRELGFINEAVTCYMASLKIEEGLVQPQGNATIKQHRLSVAYNNLGGALKLGGKSTDSIAAYKKAVSLLPTPLNLTSLGSAYKDLGLHDKAIAAYQYALNLEPNSKEAFAMLVNSMQCIADWRNRDSYITKLEQIVREELAQGKVPAVQPFHAMGYPFPCDLLKEISESYANKCMLTVQNATVTFQKSLLVPLLPGERLRIGFVSSDFGNHPLSHLMGSVFGLLDKSRYEVFCYSLSPNDLSLWHSRISTEAEHFVDVHHLNFVTIAEQIVKDRIHIAFNLNGYTKGARNEIFALKPAPCQASFMGFPYSLGAQYIPYMITDKVVCPPESRAYYTEASLVRMPNCYFVNDYKRSFKITQPPPSRLSLSLPEKAVVYACPNQLYKVDPQTLDLWCRILQRVPCSVLWLLRFPPQGEEKMKVEAASRGIDRSRIIFTDVAAKEVHIARLPCADVYLDTFLYNSHTCGCDILWAGVPLITCPGERMSSRVAASLVNATGLGERMVAHTADDYVEMAVHLGLNEGARLALRKEIEERKTACALFDTERWVSDFQMGLDEMWKQTLEGIVEDIDIEEARADVEVLNPGRTSSVCDINN